MLTVFTTEITTQTSWVIMINSVVKNLQYVFTNPSAQSGWDTRSIFKWNLTDSNSVFSFPSTSCLTKAEEPRLSYLPIAGGRIIEFITIPRVLELCEMLSASSRSWTRIAESISYDDNHYTTDTSNLLCIYIYIYILIIADPIPH